MGRGHETHLVIITRTMARSTTVVGRQRSLILYNLRDIIYSTLVATTGCSAQFYSGKDCESMVKMHQLFFPFYLHENRKEKGEKTLKVGKAVIRA